MLPPSDVKFGDNMCRASRRWAGNFVQDEDRPDDAVQQVRHEWAKGYGKSCKG